MFSELRLLFLSHWLNPYMTQIILHHRQHKVIGCIRIAASIMKRKSIGARLSTCFTLTVDSNSIVVVLPFLNLILASLYNLLMILIKLSGIPYFFWICKRRFLFTLSKALLSQWTVPKFRVRKIFVCEGYFLGRKIRQCILSC